MPDQKQPPRTDDFRIERDGDKLILTFTPDGRSFTFSVVGDRLSEPSVTPAQAGAGGYADDEVRSTATELARLALMRAPRE